MSKGIKYTGMEENMDKKIIVMGASSGIGREVARLFLQRGFFVGLAARRSEPLKKLKKAFPDQAEILQIDVTREDAPALLRELIRQLGGMDVYFHAAGVGDHNETLMPDIEMKTVDTNAVGFTRMVGEAYRYFAEKGEGHIACITSIAGTKGLGPTPSYSATKAFQNVYLQALEQEAHTRHLAICFTDIRPGFVDTPLLSKPYPMLMKPERVAKAIVRAILHRRHVLVIDWRWRILTALWQRMPRFLWRRIKI